MPQISRFILLKALPMDVTVKGINFRLQVEQESVSGGCRLMAVALGRKEGSSAWLCATAGKREDLERLMFYGGLKFNPEQGAFGVFEELVRDGRAKELPL